MRIHVVADDTINPQAGTYAEYRLFAALSQLADTERVREARVVLRRAKHHGCDGVACTVTGGLHEAGDLRIRTTDAHAYAAINRAVERLRAVRVAGCDAGAAAANAYQ